MSSVRVLQHSDSPARKTRSTQCNGTLGLLRRSGVLSDSFLMFFPKRDRQPVATSGRVAASLGECDMGALVDNRFATDDCRQATL